MIDPTLKGLVQMAEIEWLYDQLAQILNRLEHLNESATPYAYPDEEVYSINGLSFRVNWDFESGEWNVEE